MSSACRPCPQRVLPNASVACRTQEHAHAHQRARAVPRTTPPAPARMCVGSAGKFQRQRILISVAARTPAWAKSLRFLCSSLQIARSSARYTARLWGICGKLKTGRRAWRRRNQARLVVCSMPLMPAARLAERQRVLPPPVARAPSPERANITPNNATHTRPCSSRIFRQTPVSGHTISAAAMSTVSAKSSRFFCLSLPTATSCAGYMACLCVLGGKFKTGRRA